MAPRPATWLDAAAAAVDDARFARTRCQPTPQPEGGNYHRKHSECRLDWSEYAKRAGAPEQRDDHAVAQRAAHRHVRRGPAGQRAPVSQIRGGRRTQRNRQPDER
jgi:hypothetical protein